jgi:hypothetical protein
VVGGRGWGGEEKGEEPAARLVARARGGGVGWGKKSRTRVLVCLAGGCWASNGPCGVSVAVPWFSLFLFFGELTVAQPSPVQPGFKNLQYSCYSFRSEIIVNYFVQT